MNGEKAKVSWVETLNIVARALNVQPQSVTGLADKIGIHRTKTRDALGVLEHDGIAIEMIEGWIHADMKNGRDSRKEAFERRAREHPLLGAAGKLLDATMRQYKSRLVPASALSQGGIAGPVTFSDEMFTACDAYAKAVLEEKAKR